VIDGDANELVELGGVNPELVMVVVVSRIRFFRFSAIKTPCRIFIFNIRRRSTSSSTKTQIILLIYLIF